MKVLGELFGYLALACGIALSMNECVPLNPRTRQTVNEAAVSLSECVLTRWDAARAAHDCGTTVGEAQRIIDAANARRGRL